jgi:HlyD family secretion protein
MHLRNLFLALWVLLGLPSCQASGLQHDASGSFEAVETIISAAATGEILQLRVEEGEELAAGQVVGQIDSTQLAAQKAQLMQSRTAILSARPQTALQTQALKKELASVVLDRARTAKLVSGGVASQRQLDDTDAKIRTLEAQIKAQESSLQTTTSSLNEQGLTVDAQLAVLEDQLTKYVLTNPLKGTVLSKYAEQHEMAILGRPLYKIADLSQIILRAYITGDQLSQIKLDQKVKVFTDDGKGGYKQAEGVVTWVSDKAEFTPKAIQTKTERANLVYAIKVRVKNDGTYKIGMYGEIGFR